MSTVADNCYRIRKHYFEDFLKLFEKEVIKQTYQYIIDKISSGFFKRDFDAQHRMYKRFAEAEISDIYGEQSDKDMTCAISIWHYKQYVYILFWSTNIKIDFEKFPKYVKDYSYWNNTDRPYDVTSQDWRSREHFYEKVIDNLQRCEYRPLQFKNRDKVNVPTISALSRYHRILHPINEVKKKVSKSKKED